MLESKHLILQLGQMVSFEKLKTQRLKLNLINLMTELAHLL